MGSPSGTGIPVGSGLALGRIVSTPKLPIRAIVPEALDGSVLACSGHATSVGRCADLAGLEQALRLKSPVFPLAIADKTAGLQSALTSGECAGQQENGALQGFSHEAKPLACHWCMQPARANAKLGKSAPSRGASDAGEHVANCAQNGGKGGERGALFFLLCAQIFGKLFHAWQPRARRIEGFAPCACTCTFHTFLHLQLLALWGCIRLCCSCSSGLPMHRKSSHLPLAAGRNPKPEPPQFPAPQQTATSGNSNSLRWHFPWTEPTDSRGLNRRQSALLELDV